MQMLNRSFINNDANSERTTINNNNIVININKNYPNNKLNNSLNKVPEIKDNNRIKP